MENVNENNNNVEFCLLIVLLFYLRIMFIGGTSIPCHEARRKQLNKTI